MTDTSTLKYKTLFFIDLFFKKSREESSLLFHYWLLVTENKHFQHFLESSLSRLLFIFLAQVPACFFDTVNRGDHSTKEQTGYQSIYLLDRPLVDLIVFIRHGMEGLSF